MASLDSLPADQRAVLQLVLQRGRSYDEIAHLLSIDRAAVRARALSAFDQLGPDTGLTDHRRALITDYLLGQLPPAVADETRGRLAESPSERAWARVLASELAPLASQPLPEIPVEGPMRRAIESYGRQPPAPPSPTPAHAASADEPASPPAAQDEPAPGAAEPKKPGRQSVFKGRRARAERKDNEPAPAPPEPKKPGRQSVFKGRRARAERKDMAGADTPPSTPAAGTAAARVAAARTAAANRPSEPLVPNPPDAPPSSRRGGAILIIAVLIVVIAAVVIFLVSSGGSSDNPVASTSSKTSTAAASATSTTGTGSTAAHVVAQINLLPPTKKGKVAGVAEVLKEGATDGIAIVATHVAPNTSKPPNAYAVWLYNSAADAHLLGFINPGVGPSGKLSTAGGLPTNAKHFKQLIITMETKSQPKQPGTIILQGPLTGVS